MSAQKNFKRSEKVDDCKQQAQERATKRWRSEKNNTVVSKVIENVSIASTFSANIFSLLPDLELMNPIENLHAKSVSAEENNNQLLKLEEQVNDLKNRLDTANNEVKRWQSIAECKEKENRFLKKKLKTFRF